LPECRQTGYLCVESGPLGASRAAAALRSLLRRDLSAMDSFEFNKIIGAVLFTCLALLSLSFAAEAIFEPTEPAKPGYEIAVQEKGAGGAPNEAAKPEEPIEKLLASASPDRGQAVSKQCGACHTFVKGGPNGQGPNLYGIVDRPRASAPGYDYSAAMKAKGGTWTIDELNKFLTKPQGYIPGTKMTFGGLARENQRADLITYLNSLADSPKPLPVAKQ
jgi:cytochrome c